MGSTLDSAKKVFNKQSSTNNVNADSTEAWFNSSNAPVMHPDEVNDTKCNTHIWSLKTDRWCNRIIPLRLPPQFEWVELNLQNDTQISQLYEFLSNNYLNDKDETVTRHLFSKQYLQWTLMVPNYHKSWHIAVRVVKSQAICGFIAAIPITIQIFDKTVPMAQIKYLTCHKKLLGNRLEPVLIRELIRRIYHKKIEQCIYNIANIAVSKPIVTAEYYSKTIKSKMLTYFPSNKNLHSMEGLREMTATDCVSAHKLLMRYLKKFEMYQHFTLNEFQHWFLRRENIKLDSPEILVFGFCRNIFKQQIIPIDICKLISAMYTYIDIIASDVYSFVIEDNDKQITDFISFYILTRNNSMQNRMKKKWIKSHVEYVEVAYLTFNIANTVLPNELINAIIDKTHYGKQRNFTVVYDLDLMKSVEYFKQLEFKKTVQISPMYFYNWRCSSIKANNCGLVLF
eukprot:245037_1